MAILPSSPFCLALIFTILFVFGSARTEFCHPQAVGSPESSLGFCFQVATYKNFSSSGYDIYMTIVIPRPEASARGWTAVGFGSKMDGALMFIVYGDPESSQPPVISARTASGHSQPELIRSTMSPSYPEIRRISSTWQRPSHSSRYSPSTYIASVSFVCRECHKWPGADIDVTSTNQPCIWAWNEGQIFDGFREDEPLDAHTHGTVDGATGSFSIDMRPQNESEIDHPSQKDNGRYASNQGEEDGQILRSRLWTFHGLGLGLSFLVLYPAGTVIIRMRRGNAFKCHWVLQLLATVIMTVGAVTGLYLHRRIDATHQRVGVAVLTSAWIQAFLGWIHHLHFVKTQRRSWISATHVFLGRVLTVTGCANVLLGMSIRGRSRTFIELLFVCVVFEMVSVGYWVISARKPAISDRVHDTFERLRGEDECFTVGDDDEGSSHGPVLDETGSEQSIREKM